MITERQPSINDRKNGNKECLKLSPDTKKAIGAINSESFMVKSVIPISVFFAYKTPMA